MCKSFLVETFDDPDSVLPYGAPVVPYRVEAVPGNVEAPAPPYSAGAPIADISTPAPKGKIMFWFYVFHFVQVILC